MGRSCFSRHMRVDSATRAFLIHAVVYIAVIALCAALALSNSPPRQWFLWVAAGWGIGILFHALKVFGYSPILGKDWEERKIREFMEEDEQEGNRWE